MTPASAQTASVGGTIKYTVTGLDDTKPVDIQLFNDSNVTVNPNNGVVTFKGTNPGGSGNYAIQGSNSAQVSSVNGQSVTGSNGVTSVGGTLTFTVTDTVANESVVPVVFQEGAPTDAQPDRLALNPDGTPSEPFGIGGTATFVPAEPASAGTFGPVTVGNFTSSSFQNAAGTTTYFYGSGDTFKQTTGSGSTSKTSDITLAQFQNLLSEGDSVSGYYTPSNQSGPSVFNITDSAPSAPTMGTATTNTTQGGVDVTWTDSSEATQGISGYTVYRAAAIAPTAQNGNTGYTCPTVGGSDWTAINTVPADPTSAQQSTTYTYDSATGTYKYTDTTANPGTGAQANQYCYTVAAVAPNAAGGTETGPADSNAQHAAAGTASVSPTAQAPAFAPNTANLATYTPAVTGTSPAPASFSIVATYNEPIDGTTVDKGDYSVTYTANGVSYPLTVTGAAPTSGSTTSVTITATVPDAAPAPTGNNPKLVVTAQKGNDTPTPNTVGNVVTNPANQLFQAVGDYMTYNSTAIQ